MHVYTCVCANMYLFSVVVMYELFSRSYRIIRIRSICYRTLVTKYTFARRCTCKFPMFTHTYIHNAPLMYMDGGTVFAIFFGVNPPKIK